MNLVHRCYSDPVAARRKLAKADLAAKHEGDPIKAERFVVERNKIHQKECDLIRLRRQYGN